MRAALRRLALRAVVPVRTRTWREASRLFVVGDGLAWSIDDDRARLTATAGRLGYEVAPAAWAPFAERQAVFHHDHFGALQRRWLESSHRLGLSYFHGRPRTPGHPEFDRAHEALRNHAARIDRVQVTHGEMHELVLSAGIDSRKIFRIPIGIDIERFPLVNANSRAAARTALGIPASAFVVGSVVKDGVGLGEGLQPKLVKGPDTLVATLSRLGAAIDDLFVLVVGPARGYVRTGLERAGIPNRHIVFDSRDDLVRAYHALDVTLVTSRQEGGPKAVLESMAAGIPVVTTRVGQTSELIVDEENGLLADVDDVEALVARVIRIHEDVPLAHRLRTVGRPTAEAYADERLDGRWAELLEDFVERGSTDED